MKTTRQQLEANNHELGRIVQQFYAWYLQSQEEVEKLRGELAHEKRKNSTSDTK